MNGISIGPVTAQSLARALDRILWDVLWKPIGLPRDIRESLKLGGDPIELIASQGSEVLGGIVANRLSPDVLELRHIALRPNFQRQSIGARLVRELVAIAERKGRAIIQTYARNTSAGFFSRLDFVPLSNETLEHPDFSRHGITFQQMECTKFTSSNSILHRDIEMNFYSNWWPWSHPSHPLSRKGCSTRTA